MQPGQGRGQPGVHAADEGIVSRYACFAEGKHAVHLYAALLSLQRERLRQPENPGFGRGIVAVSVVAEGRARTRHHHSSITLFPHRAPRRLRDVESAEQVNADDVTDIGDGQVGKLGGPQESRIVDQHMHSAELLQCLVHQRAAALGC